ncbi:membrane-associated protein containing RNA-binding TRAM domain and ribonuclease PIN-domain, YacL B.subtilis ortholog [Microcystis sp. 0824]|nr:membrane-associated protein containing RNA-binding TRAM domain and ribonuclease PIN-domain, YacL B.subtilis ortholog [Microcystis sp. 0824]
MSGKRLGTREVGCGVWGVGCGVWGVGCGEVGKFPLKPQYPKTPTSNPSLITDY